MSILRYEKISKSLFGANILLEKSRNVLINYGFKIFIALVFLSAIIKKISVDKYNGFSNYISYYFVFFLLVILSVGIITYFSKVLFYLFFSASKSKDASISIHEAGHALVAELIFPKSNKQTLICKGLFGCWDGAKYNAAGINIIDIDKLDTYRHSNRCNELEFLQKKMYIFLAGFVAEFISQEPEVIMTFFKKFCVNPPPGSDFEKCVQISLEISNLTGQDSDILFKNAIYEVKQILDDNKGALAHIYNLLERHRKIKGTTITKIVKKYGASKTYSYKKFSRFTYIRMKLISLILKQSTVNLIVTMFHELNRALKQSKNDLGELKELIRANPNKVKSPRFIGIMLLTFSGLISYIWFLEWLF